MENLKKEYQEMTVYCNKVREQNFAYKQDCEHLKRLVFQESNRASTLDRKLVAAHNQFKKDHEFFMNKVKQVEAERIKLAEDLRIAREGREQVLYEYKLVMSERDIVNKETEKLQDDLNTATKELQHEKEENKRFLEEIKKLKLINSQLESEKEQLLKECYELREKHGDYSIMHPSGGDSPTPMSTPPNYSSRSSISRSLGKSSSSDLLGNGGNSKVTPVTSWHSSYGHFSPLQQQQLHHNNSYHIQSIPGHQVSASSSSSSVSTLSHLPLTTTSSGAKLACIGKSFDTSDSAVHEIDFLKKQNSQLKKDLQESQMEAEIAKKRRDWAILENKKIVLERESIKNFCDSLRKERNQRDRELSKALTDNDELKRQLTEAIQALAEQKETETTSDSNASTTTASSSGGNVIASPSTGSSVSNTSASNSTNVVTCGSVSNSPRHAVPDPGRSRDSAIHTDTELHDLEPELLQLSLKDRHTSESSKLTHHGSSSLVTNTSGSSRLDPDTADPPNSPVSVTEGETAPSSPMPPPTPSSCSIILQGPHMNHYSLRSQQVQPHASSIPHHMSHHPPHQILPHHLSQQSSHHSTHGPSIYAPIANAAFDHRMPRTYHLPSASFSPSPSPSTSSNSHFFVPF